MTLAKAIEAGNIGYVEQLLAKKNASTLTEPDAYGQYPLHYASVHGKLDIVTFLVEKAGADVNCTTHTGTTPAHYAARSNRVPVLEYLLSKGADVGARDTHGWTPLHCAALAGYVTAVRTIIGPDPAAPRVDINAQEVHGFTALHLACFNGFTDVAAALIAAGADFTRLGGGLERARAEYPLRMLPLRAKDPLALDDSLLRLQRAVRASCDGLRCDMFTHLYEQKRFADFELCFNSGNGGGGGINGNGDSAGSVSNRAVAAVVVVKAHKAVLYSRMGFFRDFDFEGSNGRYNVPEQFSRATMEYLLEWCYTGSVRAFEGKVELRPAGIPDVVRLIEAAEFYRTEQEAAGVSGSSNGGGGGGLPELCISGLARGLTADIVEALVLSLVEAKEPSVWIDKLCVVAVEGLLSLSDTAFSKKAYDALGKFSKRRIEAVVLGLRPLLTNKQPETSPSRFENIVAPPPPPPLYDEILMDDDNGGGGGDGSVGANNGNDANTPQEKLNDRLVAEEREKKLHQFLKN